MRRFVPGAFALAFALPAMGQQSAAPSLPLWEAWVVGGALSTPAYPGAAQRSSRVLALPFLVYRGEVLRSEPSGIGARLVHTDQVEFDVGFAASLPAHSDTGGAREGMPNLGLLVEFGPRVKLLLANPTSDSRLRLELPLRAVIELYGGVRRQGTTFEPKLVFDMREPGSPWSYDASLSLVLGDRAVNRYFYEVQPQFATPERPAYNARAGLMLVRAGLSASYRFDRDLRLFGFLRQENYAVAANRHSPLMKKNSGTSIGVGFAWTFGRSSSPARGAPSLSAPEESP